MAKEVKSKLASLLDNDLKEGDSWKIGPLFPGLTDEPLVAKVLSKSKDFAQVELRFMDASVDMVQITRLTNSVSVSIKEA